MKRKIHQMKRLPRILAAAVMFVTLGGSFAVMSANSAQAAACPAQSTNYGSATADVNIPAAATYRIWSRIMVPDTTNNSYLLEVDGANCYTVGGVGVTPNAWTWVDYQDGSTSSKVTASLSQGVHKIKVIGKQPGVKFDRVVFTSDMNCVPTGNGDNCNTPADTTLPTVSVTGPSDSSAIKGKLQVTANATDNVGVREVMFYANSTLLGSDTSAPYSVEWDTTKFANGKVTLIARAYDTAGNSNSSSRDVTVQNTVSDTQPPSQPVGVSAAALAYNKVEIKWQASTDNTGVAGYKLTRDGAPLVTLGATATSYQDLNLIPSTTYKYKVTAFDAAGNVSLASQEATATTPAVPDTEAPSVPTNVTATAVSSRQINVSWRYSTDNIAVKEYEVYRSTGSGNAVKVATVTNTSLGDTDLQPGTEYSYTIKAKDAAGNTSQASSAAKAKTSATVRTSVVLGMVHNGSGGQVKGARVTISVQNAKYTATTDSGGRYIIRDVPRGKYTFTFSATGYQTKSSSRTIADDYTWQEVTLRKNR